MMEIKILKGEGQTTAESRRVAKFLVERLKDLKSLNLEAEITDSSIEEIFTSLCFIQPIRPTRQSINIS